MVARRNWFCCGRVHHSSIITPQLKLDAVLRAATSFFSLTNHFPTRPFSHNRGGSDRYNSTYSEGRRTSGISSSNKVAFPLKSSHRLPLAVTHCFVRLQHSGHRRQCKPSPTTSQPPTPSTPSSNISLSFTQRATRYTVRLRSCKSCVRAGKTAQLQSRDQQDGIHEQAKASCSSF